MSNPQKVIAIDGPSASGKGTIAERVAEKLGFAYLDSGALYRLCALDAQTKNVSWEDEPSVVKIAQQLNIRFFEQEIYLDDQKVTGTIRQEAIGLGASKIAKCPAVRTALLERQRAFLTEQGLVADGRDMGSVVFPEATLKIFLTASALERANRRFLQLQKMGKMPDYEAILKDIETRDFNDQNREIAPLKHYPDAQYIDTSNMSIEQVVETVYQWYQDKPNK